MLGFRGGVDGGLGGLGSLVGLEVALSQVWW